MASRKNSIVHLFDDVGPSAAQCDDICNTSTKTAAKAM